MVEGDGLGGVGGLAMMGVVVVVVVGCLGRKVIDISERRRHDGGGGRGRDVRELTLS